MSCYVTIEDRALSLKDSVAHQFVSQMRAGGKISVDSLKVVRSHNKKSAWSCMVPCPTMFIPTNANAGCPCPAGCSGYTTDHNSCLPPINHYTYPLGPNSCVSPVPWATGENESSLLRVHENACAETKC